MCVLQARALRRRLKPYMLRRRKEDVTKDIPPKEETIIDVELTMVQKKYYRAIYERNHSVLNKVKNGLCTYFEVYIYHIYSI